MKYMEKGGFKHNPLMRLTLSLMLGFFLFFWLTNFGMYFRHMDLTPGSVTRYYLGNEETFQVPRSYESLVETSHYHFPMMALVMLMLTHLVIFVPWEKGVKVVVILLSFVSAFFQESSSWLVRFVSPHFAYLKILSFLVLQSMMLLLMLALAAYLWGWGRQKKH